MQCEQLFNALADPAAIVDSEGIFLAVNDKLLEISGYKKKELLGSSFLRTKFMSKGNQLKAQKHLAKRLRGLQIPLYELDVLTKGGKKIIAEMNAVKIEYKGKPASFVLIRDISARKATEKKLRSILDASPNSIVVVDMNGKCVECNQATLDLHGFSSKEEIIGKKATELLPKKEHLTRILAKAHSESCLRGGSSSKDDMLKWRRNSSFVTYIIGLPSVFLRPALSIRPLSISTAME